jgi:hypothetical protein
MSLITIKTSDKISVCSVNRTNQTTCLSPVRQLLRCSVHGSVMPERLFKWKLCFAHPTCTDLHCHRYYPAFSAPPHSCFYSCYSSLLPIRVVTHLRWLREMLGSYLCWGIHDAAEGSLRLSICAAKCCGSTWSPHCTLICVIWRH